LLILGIVAPRSLRAFEADSRRPDEEPLVVLLPAARLQDAAGNFSFFAETERTVAQAWVIGWRLLPSLLECAQVWKRVL
jgi:hypothetical protein